MAHSRSTLILIACGAKKLAAPARARDLYTGSLFRKARAAAIATGSDWSIVSALHGLVEPDRVLKPYEAALRTAGGGIEPSVLCAKLERQLRPVRDRFNVVALLPHSYGSALPAGVPNVMPAGLPIGKMLQWLSLVVVSPELLQSRINDAMATARIGAPQR